jgi:hypothetical protein
MTTDENTRVEFAERHGWNKTAWAKWHNGDRFIEYCELPNPTDHNHVHAALMGMSDNEWIIFQIKLCEDRPIMPKRFVSTPLSTIVACYLEATKGRVK